MYNNWPPKLMCYLWVLANDSCTWPSFINHAKTYR